MSEIETLIANAESRASTYASGVDNLVTELRGFVRENSVGKIDVPPLDQITNAELPTYTVPQKDATPLPVYEDPGIELPQLAELVQAIPITLPPDRTSPTVNTSGLFTHEAPTVEILDFEESDPMAEVDSLVAEMSNLVAPELQVIDMPIMTTLEIGSAPVYTLPTLDASPVPDQLRDPDDYASAFENAYNRMLPEMQAYIDDKVNGWVSQYAPEYVSWQAQLQVKVTQGMDGGILPDQFEAAMFTRAQGRAEREFSAAEDGFLESFAKSGFIAPPGALSSAVLTARLKSADALANQATDIYLERRRTEVQHVQLVMNLAASQIQSVRNNAIAYAGVIANTMQLSISYSNSIAEKLGNVFDHLIARAQLSVSILQVLNAQYEVKLKASLSALEGYKLELDAAKAKKDVELAQVQFVEARVRVSELEVQRFSAMVEAIARKMSVGELKLKAYQVRADVFKTKNEAKIAGIGVYKAMVEGDKAELEGRLAQLRVFEAQLKGDEMRLETQTKAIEAANAVNNAKIKAFEGNSEVYKLVIETALKKFQSQAEIKKLGQAIYAQELANASQTFTTGLEVPKIKLNAIIKQYEMQIETLLKQATIDVQKLSIAEHASASSVAAFQAMAASALGSLNTVSSKALSTSA